MRLISTSDISLNELKEWAIEVGGEYAIEVDEQQDFCRSPDAPSWVTLIAGADWWLKILGACVGVYFAAIANEAGKDTWKNKSSIAAAFSKSGSALRHFAQKLFVLRLKLPQSKLVLSLPVPSDDFGTSLVLQGDTAEELGAELALFVHHLPKIQELIRSEGSEREGVVNGNIHLTLRIDGSLEVSWMDSTTLLVKIRYIE